MFASARRALRLIFEPAYGHVVVRAVVLTLLLGLAELVALEWLIAALPVLGNAIVNKTLAVLAPVLTIFLLGALGAPVAALFGSVFLDGLAARIEARDYPADPPAALGGFWTSLKTGIRLTLLILGADLALLPVDLGLPGLGWIANLALNGWLLGWEYFELVALRHVPVKACDDLRLKNRGLIWLAGGWIALLSVVPVVNLFAPLFGTAQMVHLFKRLQRNTP